MFDLNSMMSKIQEAQQKMKAAQEALVHLTAEGDAGAGMVKATVNGNRQLISLEIDPAILTKDDKQMVQDLTIAATNKALEAIEEKIKESLKASTSGVMPNIPGFDLSNLM